MPLVSRPICTPPASIFWNICSGVTPPSTSGELFANQRMMLGSMFSLRVGDGRLTHVSTNSPGEISGTAHLPCSSTVRGPAGSVAAGAAVDRVDGAADVGGFVGGQERRQAGDLFRGAHRFDHARPW